MNFMPVLFGDKAASFWFPEQASTFAPEVDFMYDAIMWISAFFFVIVVGAMIYFVYKFRDRPGYKASTEAIHNNNLEIAWTVIPSFIVVWIFARGVTGYMDMMTPPTDTIDVNVAAQKWNWGFTYPNGAITTELHLPVGRPARMIMRSSDVIHSFYIPAFRVKTDVVPGRVNIMWFEATKEGTYDLFCTEYCGTKHSEMLAKVVVEPQEVYDAWVEKQASPPEPPVEHGQWLYERVGCKGCHSIDGTKVVGPSFKGSFGGDVQLAVGGDVPMNEEYIRESILYPQKKARSGYETASQMPSYQGRLKEKEIIALTEFIKSLKD